MFLIRATLLLSLLPIAIIATAAEDDPLRWYQVELILFKQAQPRVESQELWEKWRENRTSIDYKNSIDIKYPVETASLAGNDKQAFVEIKQNSDLLSSGSGTEEVMTENLLHKNEQEQTAIEDPVAELQPFTFSSVTAWTLTEQFKKIDNLSHYQILIHTAWIQPGLSREDAIAVHIYDHMARIEAPESANSDLINNSQESLNSTSLEPSNRSPEAKSYPLEADENRQPPLFDKSINSEGTDELLSAQDELATLTFNGTLTLSRARYLHVDLNLDYAPEGFPPKVADATDAVIENYSRNDGVAEYDLSGPRPETVPPPPLYEAVALNVLLNGVEQPQQIVYNMHESRRMRSQKLHYLDHPKIGLLIKIVPVANSTEDEHNSTEDEQ